MKIPKYDFKKIEKKWQANWDKKKIYVAKDKSKKPNKYVLIEFPYPSGEGLHMGHLRPYVAGDVYSRYLRMKGNEVMYPIGWDAFGLPAENFAIKKGVHPAVSTAKNIKNAKNQIKSWGIGFDWSREVNTTDPNYYKWTQWLFLQFYKKGLAYESKGFINWCPKDKTGLANEEVIAGKCDRCGTVVEQKEMRQWYLRITAYAEQLLKGLKNLDWPEQIKVQQTNWIGKSEGAEIDFKIAGSDEVVRVFTTRPDTLFGATYMVLAPEHPLIEELANRINNIKKVREYVSSAEKKTEEERIENKNKTGVELKGLKAINPTTEKEIPVWVSDYVLSGYGTGAIMAVPAHDARDFEFAKKFKLEIIPVIQSVNSLEGEVMEDGGVLINSGEFNGLSSEEAKVKIIKLVHGKKKVQYHLRDWVFSRQRYWGEPIPLIHCEKCGIVPVPEKDLPVKLPAVKKYEPTGTGDSPLASVKAWLNVKCPNCKGNAKRETNTMPQWAGSSWYYLRYTDSKNKKAFASKELMKKWLPVDAYFGGLEHTTLHLLYSRFWHLFLYDQGLVPASEPYARRIPHGIILGADGEKMSKSRGNVVNPDEIVKNFGADALRMCEMFLGPHDAMVSWSDGGILGITRFLERVWKVAHSKTFISHGFKEDVLEKKIHQTIKKITEGIEGNKFNTAVSSLMIFMNELEKHERINKSVFERFLILLAPFAPHVTEELWSKLKNKKSIHLTEWPNFDEKIMEEDSFTLVIQVNGKVRDTLLMPKGASEEEIKHIVLEREKIRNLLQNTEPRAIIYVQNRLINIVI